jgi:hypothetical protein
MIGECKLDALITNISTEIFFVSGPNLDVPVGGSVVWSNVNLTDFDQAVQLKDGILAGKVTVTLAGAANELVQPEQDGRTGMTDSVSQPQYTKALLPTGFEGETAYCTDGRKVGEGGGAGTGCPVYFSGTKWYRYGDDTEVAT